MPTHRALQEVGPVSRQAHQRRSSLTIIVVDGCMGRRHGLDRELRAVRPRGFPAVARANPLRSLTRDAACLADVLKPCPARLVLVGHSYGAPPCVGPATGNGVSAVIDMALSLTERVHGRELAESLQLVIEYDPLPPFDSGSPTKAYASTLRLAFGACCSATVLFARLRVNGHAAAARLRRLRRLLSKRGAKS